MLENIFAFRSVIPSTGVDAASFLACLLTAAGLGILISFCFRFRNRSGQSILLTLALLPLIVTVIGMLVGNRLGAGIAVAGTFSLVRFRSQPGTAREICALLLTCAVGFACGAGYLMIAGVLTLAALIIGFFYTLFNVGGIATGVRALKITIPESLDYEGVFDDLLKQYTSSWSLTRVRTTAMGSLYELTYEIVLRGSGTEKELLDAIRCRNGNLEVQCGRPVEPKGEL